jgi:hypothetical protein
MREMLLSKSALVYPRELKSLLKIDISKTYDRIDLRFMKGVSRRIEFDEMWVRCGW